MIIFDVTMDAEAEADPMTACLHMTLVAAKLGVKVRGMLQGVQVTAEPAVDFMDLWQRWQALKAGRISPDPAPAQEGGEEV